MTVIFFLSGFWDEPKDSEMAAKTDDTASIDNPNDGNYLLQ